MRVLVLDNGDPGLADLVGPLEDLAARCDVRSAGSITLQEIRDLDPPPQRILLASGPGEPEDAGVCPEVVLHLGGYVPIVGIGLGMRVIAQVARGQLQAPAHETAPGSSITTVRHDGKNLFAGLPSPFEAPRGSAPPLVLDSRKLSTDLEVSAWDERGTVVGCRVWALSMEGIEIDTRWLSTQLGSDLLFNFLYQAQAW
jgi:anthranilate/para-aminobenzoate synthase component II